MSIATGRTCRSGAVDERGRGEDAKRIVIEWLSGWSSNRDQPKYVEEGTMQYRMMHIALALCLPILLSGCAVQSQLTEPESTSPSEERPDLREIMVGLGEESSRLDASLWVEDFDAMAAAADSIANHPKVSDTDRALIQTALGPDFAEFVKGDQRVHETGLALSEAAAAQNMEEALVLYAQLQRECVACHTSFRDRLKNR